MSIRLEGKRLAANVTTVLSVASLLVAGFGSLVLWRQTEAAKSPTASFQQSGDDGSSGGGDGQIQSNIVSPGGSGGVQSQSTGS
ncbi:MAG: hypothetical protein V4479_03030 [Actinomycetota bacterium]